MLQIECDERTFREKNNDIPMPGEPVGEGNGTGWWRVPASVVWVALIFKGMICILGGRLRKADPDPAKGERDDKVCYWPG